MIHVDRSIGAEVRASLVSLPAGDLNRVAAFLAQESAIAGVIVEPSGGSWGRVPLEIDFLRGLRAAGRIGARRQLELLWAIEAIA